MYTTATRGRSTVLALTLLAAGTPAVAQSNGNIRSSALITIKADRVGDFQAAAKDYVAILKKANWDKSYTVWRSLTGQNRYRLTMWAEKWAEFDMNMDPKLKDVSADLTRILGRILACEESSERIFSEVNPELSLPRGSEPPKMIRILRSVVKPDRTNEYLALVKSDVVPAVKKAEVKVFSVARVRYGAPSNEFVSVLGFSSWADLDKLSPIVQGMGGSAKYEEFLAKVRPLLVTSQYDIFRYEPDLSYFPAK